MMPGTAHGIADHQPIDERTAVMRTLGSDRKHFSTAAHQQNLVITHSSEELAGVGKVSRSDAFREIGAGQSA
jgi:hypothetical protein